MAVSFPGRRALSGGARLTVALPLVGLGFVVMILSLVLWGLFSAAVMAGLGIMAVVGAADLFSTTPPAWTVGVVAVGAALLGLWVWSDRAWTTIRDGLRLEPAAMVARTRTPDGDDPDETRVSETVRRLCLGADLPVPELRVREATRPLCYSVRYPVEDPPREVLKADVDRFREWNLRAGESDRTYADDRPIPAESVLVVSTGLIESLDADELEAVLAHEVAHLRNDDLRLMNALLLPVFWSESIVGFEDAGELGEYVLAAERWVRGSFVRTVSMLGIAVFSRGREFAADAAAAELTGTPAALASALERLDGDGSDRPAADLRTVGVVNVLPTAGQADGILATHPPTADRIERLREMVR